MRFPPVISARGPRSRPLASFGAEEPKGILEEVAPFILVVVGIPVVLLLATPRKPGESAILRRPQSWRR